MKAVFADTFYWIALTVPTDTAHRRAHQVTDSIVTRDEVLSEYLTFFCTSPESLRRQAAENVRDILGASSVHVIAQSRESFLAGLELYTARLDKGYSLIDCISMAVMRREGLTVVLTNDRHFEQEGFRVLFRGCRDARPQRVFPANSFDSPPRPGPGFRPGDDRPVIAKLSAPGSPRALRRGPSQRKLY